MIDYVRLKAKFGYKLAIDIKGKLDMVFVRKLERVLENKPTPLNASERANIEAFIQYADNKQSVRQAKELNQMLGELR